MSRIVTMAQKAAQMKDQNTALEGRYLHIYNRGASNGIVFKDNKDYETFIGYLEQYLSPPPSEEEQQETFVIRGKEYKGKPHTRKNYHGELELLAYNLSPNHFHLLFRQTSDDSHQNFMRSLGTRYSMYFNKRHNRSGSLYAGPYRSVEVKDTYQLPDLTRYLHQHLEGYSSYGNYTGEEDVSWVNPGVVLKILDELSEGIFKENSGYKSFVEEYFPKLDADPLFKKLIIEKREAPLPASSKTNTDSVQSGWDKDVPMETLTIIPDVVNSSQRFPRVNALRVPEVAVMSVMFVVLLILGFRSVRASKEEKRMVAPRVGGYATSENVEAKQPEAEEVQSLVSHFEAIVVGDVGTVNIMRNPTAGSEVIEEATGGRVFGFLSMKNGWCEIQLDDGSVGYVPANFVTIMEKQK